MCSTSKTEPMGTSTCTGKRRWLACSQAVSRVMVSRCAAPALASVSSRGALEADAVRELLRALESGCFEAVRPCLVRDYQRATSSVRRAPG
jgi:hypothetical protein